MQNQHLIVLGFAEHRFGVGTGAAKLIAGPEIDGNAKVALIEKARKGQFPKGVKLLRAFHCLPHAGLVAIAPETDAKK